MAGCRLRTTPTRLLLTSSGDPEARRHRICCGRWLLNQRIKDTLCGTKVIRRENYEQLAANRAYFGDFDPFGDFDLLFGASKLNLKIIEIPIRYRARQYGETQISRFRHGFLLLRMCLYATRKLKLI